MKNNTGYYLFILFTSFTLMVACKKEGVKLVDSTDFQVEFPGAFPGGNFLENNGVLFAAEGEGLFTIAVSFKSDTSIIRQNVYNHIHSIGPMAPDGSYYELELRDYDGIATAEKRDALKDMLSNPGDWPIHQVIEAKELLRIYDCDDYDKIKKHIRITVSERAAGEIIASVESLTDSTEIFLEFGSPWNGKASWKSVDSRSIIGTTRGLRDTVLTSYLLLRTDRDAIQSDIFLNQEEMVLAMSGREAERGNEAGYLKYLLNKGETISIVAKTSSSESLTTLKVDGEKISSALQKKRDEINGTQLHGVGEFGAAAENIRSAVTMLINYDMGEGRRYVNLGYGGKRRQIHPGWDPAFDAINASFVDPDLALEHQFAFLNGRKKMEPSFHQKNWGAVHANSVWSLYQKFGKIELLEFAYPILQQYYDFLKSMDVNNDGLLEVFYWPGRWMGVDDGPLYDDIKQIGELTDLTGIDINFYYALTAERLSQISSELGLSDYSESYSEDFKEISKKINELLWNEELGIYLSRYLSGRWNFTKTPMSFYPLICGIPNRQMAQRMVDEHLLNPAEFWGEYVIPSVSFDDPEFHGKDLYEHFEEGADKSRYEEWRGTIWPPSNYLVYTGLKRYGFDSVAAEFAQKSTNLWLSTWNKYNWFPEYFDALPGRPVNDVAANTAHRYQSWSMAMPLTGIQELIDIEPWSKNSGIRFGTLAAFTEKNEIHNVYLKGKKYSVLRVPEKLRVMENDKEILQVSNGNCIIRDFSYNATTCSFIIKTITEAEISVKKPAVRKTAKFTIPSGEHFIEIAKGSINLTDILPAP